MEIYTTTFVLVLNIELYFHLKQIDKHITHDAKSGARATEAIVPLQCNRHAGHQKTNFSKQIGSFYNDALMIA